MTRERFKKQEAGSFFGDWLYAKVVPEDHFLRKSDAIVPWQTYTELLMQLYSGGAMYGRPPYDPAVILKMLLISYLYNLSERATEQHAGDSLVMKWFLRLAVDEPAPDHSTLSRFRKRLIRKDKGAALEEILADIVRLAKETGVQFGSIQVIDSVHTSADVNPRKDKDRQKKEGKPPRDGGAAWGVKRTKRVYDRHGNEVMIPDRFFGFKTHASLNALSGLITNLMVTAGNAHDGHILPHLVHRDLAVGMLVSTVTADRGYDDSGNHELLRAKGIHSAIILNHYRTHKKDPAKQVWIDLKASEAYQLGIRERYKIERKFGEAKQGHGFGRCRYLGIPGYQVQAYLTAITLNLKRLVKLQTGTGFRGTASVCA